MKLFSSSLKKSHIHILAAVACALTAFAQDDFFNNEPANGETRLEFVQPDPVQENTGFEEPVDVEADNQQMPVVEPAEDVSAADGQADEESAKQTPSRTTETPDSEPRSFWSRLFRKSDAEEPAKAEVEDEIDREINDLLEEVQDDIRIANGDAGGDVDLDLSVAEDDPDMKPVDIVAVQEEVRRQAKEIEAMKNIEEGYSLMQQGKYEDALKNFEKGLQLLPRRAATVEIRGKTTQSQSECEYRIALKMYDSGNYDKAIEASKRALKYYPAHDKAERLLTRSEYMYEKQRMDSQRPIKPSEEPERLEKVEKITATMRKGRQLMAIREYEKAREQFYEVLRIDPGNDEAHGYLRDIGNIEYGLNTDAMLATKADMLAQVRDRWSPPVPSPETGLGTLDPRPQGPGVDMSPARAELVNKLNTIVIPELNFRDANIVDVVDFLVNTSIEVDPSPTRKGVNILLQRRQTGASSAPPPPMQDDAFLFDSPAPSAPAGTSDIPTITMSLRNMLLIDAIRYITDFSQLKYRIEDHAVIIYPADMAVGRIITRVYTVQPSITEVIFGAGDSGGGADAADPFSAEFGSAPSAERQDVKKFFMDAGVPFPEKTSIVYKPSISKLFVSNTAENLERFEDILRMLDVIPKQIQIEARFVEIGQNDLEELGVQWLLTDNWEIMQKSGASAPIPLGGQERLQVNKNEFTRGLRYMAPGVGGEQPSAASGGTMGGILSISSVLTNPELSFVLHALNQKQGVNLLSSPRITTKSGMNAEIKIVKELSYPTEFSRDVDTSSGDNDRTTVVTTPTAFETRDVGVILNVTPVVGPDGVTIDLTMIPQVVELSEWVNYGGYNPETGRTDNMPQPVFHSRHIATSISIWDGQTVVMGGLITEAQATTEDKIPFLGDLPLIGALFRSKTSSSQKKNLMIFVTAEIVDPAGRRINTPGSTDNSSQSYNSP